MRRQYEYSLRLIDNADDVPLHERKRVFIGTQNECKAFAEKLGFTKFIRDSSLFSGYWTSPNGDCLVPT